MPGSGALLLRKLFKPWGQDDCIDNAKIWPWCEGATIEVPVIEHLRCEKPGARLLCKPNRTVEPLGMR